MVLELMTKNQSRQAVLHLDPGSALSFAEAQFEIVFPLLAPLAAASSELMKVKPGTPGPFPGKVSVERPEKALLPNPATLRIPGRYTPAWPSSRATKR